MRNPFQACALLLRALAGSPSQQRYEARFRLLRYFARRWGFHLYDRHLAWREDEEFLDLLRQFNPNSTDVIDRNYVLYHMAKSVGDIPADTAECGVFQGLTSFLICTAMLGAEDTHCYPHHAFDSFEGLSEPQQADIPAHSEVFHWKAKDKCASLHVAQDKLSRFDFVRYYPGWIPSRFVEVADREFSFVHVDVDLYQPASDSLRFFYERMIRGGILLCDDYNFTSCPGARKAFDEFIKDKPERFVIPLTSGQGFIIKR